MQAKRPQVERDPATNRITVRFTSKEYMQFLNMFERSGANNKATFLKAQFFGQEFRVRAFDQSKHEYYARLSDFHGQFRMVGNRSALPLCLQRTTIRW